jgi:ribulose-phosphate 3-epimerase
MLPVLRVGECRNRPVKTWKPRLVSCPAISGELAAHVGRLPMDAKELAARLRGSSPLVGPSLLAADFANLESDIRRAEEAGAEILHLDIMDGHFVPNLSFGLPVVEAVRRVTRLPLDVHLMISDPATYLRRFRDAGADLITFHIEVVPDPTALLKETRRLGACAGLSLNPPTAVAALEPFVDQCDLVLVMSVMPGFGGQAFQPAALDKLRRLREVGGERLLLSVDGGVDGRTIGPCAEAGANLFVVGTHFFSAGDYRQRMVELTGAARATAGARS